MTMAVIQHSNLQTENILLLLLVFILSCVYLWKRSVSSFPEGPWSIPFTKNQKLLHARPHIRLTQLRDVYGEIFSVKLGRQRAVVVSSFEGLNEGLVKKAFTLSGRPGSLLSGVFNKELLQSNPSLDFKIKRDFALKSLNSLCYKPHIEETMKAETEKLASFLLSQRNVPHIQAILEPIFLRLIMFVVNGKLYSNDDANFHEIWKTFQINSQLLVSKWEDLKSISLFQSSVSYNFFQIRERSEIQMAYQRDIVNRHKDCFNPNIVSDLVDCSLVMLELNEDSGVLSQEDLDGIFVELCSSGNQPISATLAWLILYVSYFPDVQDKIYQELTSVMGIERSPRMSDQPHLPYTCAVILETQRLATVLPFMYPHMATEDTQFMGYKIPKDTAMLFNVWSLHHDAKHWKHPMKFDPDRFLEDGDLRIPDQYLPFGDGLRSCPGEGISDILLFLFSTNLLYYLRFDLQGKVDLEGEMMGYVLAPKPFSLTVTPRETVVIDIAAELGETLETSVCMIEDDVSFDDVLD
ncbi:cytochrome P450 2J6-like isoform X2 [Mya arenaria]|nr:cytochrome P450 2J6-like isoform X2 [Mya arenaria]XP_052797462.1 cytochrome P450 2J6-like isoform X2 [Mya arenaria]